MKNRIRINKSHLFGVLAILLLYSCVPTQKAIREENKFVPEQYKNRATDTVNLATVNWKDFFVDPKLIELIETALANNQELNIMLQQIAMANNS